MKRLVAAVFALALAACGDEGELTELSRLTSPDGAWDAVLVRLQGSRGNESPYMVLMGPKGVGTSKAARVFLGDHLDAEPQVVWQDGNRMAIRCGAARVWTFHNFFNAPNGAPAASIALECGAGGYAASNQN